MFIFSLCISTMTILQWQKQSGASSSTTKSQKWKRVTLDSMYASVEARNALMNKAVEIEANLQKSGHHTFMKIMLPSNLGTLCWLGLSKKFCDQHMPLGADSGGKNYKKIWLIGDNGKVFRASYFWRKPGIGGGWRGFASHHKLQVGDALIFQLLSPAKFKVHIVRANGAKKPDVAHGASKSDTATQSQPSEVEVDESNDTGGSMDIDDGDEDEDEGEDYDDDDGSMAEASNGTNLEGSSMTAHDFKQVKCFKDFNIVTNGTVIDDQFPEPLRLKYYELCRSQGSFLHQGRLESYDYDVRIVIGVIADTVHIADSIMEASSKVGSVGRDEDFEKWEKKLEGLESIGMNVGFMLARLRKVAHLGEKANRYEKLVAERAAAKEELQNLAMRVGKVGERVEVLDAEIEQLELGGGIDRGFEELANASW